MKNVVQPHGALFVLDAKDHAIVGASESARSLLGLSPRDLVGYPLARLGTAADLRQLTKALLEVENAELEDLDPIDVTTHWRRRLQATARGAGDHIIVELEEASDVGRPRASVMSRLRRSITHLRAADDLDDLSARAATELRALSGFDRVVAHAVRAGEGERSASYMHFLRSTDYEPSVVRAHPGVVLPDLTRATLWSPTSAALADLRALGITAMMELSWADGDGVVLAHHRSGPRSMSRETRDACVLLAAVHASLVDQRDLEPASSPRLRSVG